MPKKLTQEEFKEKSNKSHSNFYNYDETIYINLILLLIKDLKNF